jgi:hypothetical protein
MIREAALVVVVAPTVVLFPGVPPVASLPHNG